MNWGQWFLLGLSIFVLYRAICIKIANDKADNNLAKKNPEEKK